MGSIYKGKLNAFNFDYYSETAKDPNLSMQAKGLLAYLLSLPADWKIHIRELPNHFTNGRDAVANALNELIESGYVQRTEVREAGKFNSYDYQVWPLKHHRVLELEKLFEQIEKAAAPKVDKQEKKKDDIPYKDIVDYLNEKASKSFKHSSKDTQKWIRARWRDDGFRLEDFKKVIDNMTAKWKDNPEMNEYLRPKTLFGTKFEGYLNMKKPSPPSGPHFPKFEPGPPQQANEDWLEEERRKILQDVGIEI